MKWSRIEDKLKTGLDIEWYGQNGGHLKTGHKLDRN
jgi:hypothetical protein